MPIQNGAPAQRIIISQSFDVALSNENRRKGSIQKNAHNNESANQALLIIMTQYYIPFP